MYVLKNGFVAPRNNHLGLSNAYTGVMMKACCSLVIYTGKFIFELKDGMHDIKVKETSSLIPLISQNSDKSIIQHSLEVLTNMLMNTFIHDMMMKKHNKINS